jgi:hypothetical protein
MGSWITTFMPVRPLPCRFRPRLAPRFGVEGLRATVVAKYEPAKVQIVRRHDEPTRHGAAPGLGWGLATGAIAALFPP